MTVFKHKQTCSNALFQQNVPGSLISGVARVIGAQGATVIFAQPPTKTSTLTQ